LESMVVDTALKGAEDALGRGEGEEAEWMIRRALRVSPYDERLYRCLLRAADIMGNRVGLRSAMAELLRVASDGASLPQRPRRWPPGVEAHASIHPRTMALFRELAHGQEPVARGDSSRL